MRKLTKLKKTAGQALTEYVVMLAIFVMVSLSFLLLLAALTGNGWRVLSLVAWEPFS